MHLENILVVDDDPIVLSITKAYFLAKKVPCCDVAKDGAEAIAMLSASKAGYQMVICDINMPGKDGIQLIAALAANNFTGWLGIVSAEHEAVCRTAMTIAESYGMKVAGLQRKPVTKDSLDRLVETVVKAEEGRARPASTLKEMSEDDLRAAIEEHRVVPFYQPLVRMTDRAVRGAEALARIENGDGSVIPPAAFIGVAERCNLLEPLTNAMFDMAMRDLKQINKLCPNFNLAINWDPKLLEVKKLPDQLEAECRKRGISPTQITLEITETMAFEASPVILEVLVRLRIKGFGVAVDDYGTGYSNVDRLQRMPFSKLKIDQSFVRRAGDDSFSLAGVETAIRLARELEMPAVAEGVEDDALWSLVQSCGASEAQGYLMSRPLPLDRFITWAHACDWRFDRRQTQLHTPQISPAKCA